MEQLLSFITPTVGALIISITVLISIAKKLRPQIKTSKFWWRVMPYLPAVIGIALSLIPGVIEGSIGSKIVIGFASAGIATMGRNMLKRSVLDSFKGEPNE